jgi:peptide/nickel transport system permease protein
MPTDAPSTTQETEILIRGIGLSRRYIRGNRWSKHRRQVQALCSVDLQIQAGSTMALVGPSGSGKSTLARCLAGIEELDAGEIWFRGCNLAKLSERDLVPLRREIQLIFQDPGASLNPRLTAVEIVSEPLLIAGGGTKSERRQRARDLMQRVGLSSQVHARLPFELSGGQRRRLAIARALALQPKLLILDEALSGLDLSMQAQICNLLMDLQETSSLTYLLISHDFGLIRHLADDVTALNSGRIVEGAPHELIDRMRDAEIGKITGRCGKSQAAFGPIGMIRYVFQRLIRIVLVFLGVSVLVFILMDITPGTYFQQMRLDQRVSRETVAALRIEYGLNQPLPVRYARWLRSLCRGEMGFSFAYNQPVWPLLRTRIGNTLILTIAALLCSWLIAIPLGVWIAQRAGHWEDRVSGVASTLLLATPDLLIGLSLLSLALHTGWLPVGGSHAPQAAETTLFGKAKDLALHLILPVCALSAGMLPVLVRHVRSAMLDVLGAPFMLAARGHGIHRYRLLFAYALPAAANPLISLLGTSAGVLLSSSLLIEVIMSWPGVGPLLLQAILERDAQVVVAAVLFSTLFLVTGNLLADILLYIVDPRIRVEP